MKNAFKKAKKAVSKAGQHIRWSSSESGSSSASWHAASERMSISTEEPKEFQTSSTHRLILILESQLVPRSQDEDKALRSLNQKTYALTKCFDKDLLIDTGMWEEFNEVFQTIGWSDFAEILEGGMILLTKEFLMTLRTDTRRDGPFHSARYTGGELDGNFTALFGALDLQEHRTLGMMDSLTDIQQQQGVDHNLILETRTTVDRTHE
ncbi:hypothetical protein U9M48_042740 [Paspalum notatum var. saurae]|uniref:Uncharacterized protein n=1 Tax=Paspalum notatum var. saurae TaxID=547442 RepID=A0AAQ3UVY1_PASNO